MISRTLFKVYPNPTSDFSLVEHQSGSFLDMRVYDYIGRDISDKFMLSGCENSVCKMDFSGLPDGVYFIAIGEEIKRLVKN